MSTTNDLSLPEDLSPDGLKAYHLIKTFLEDNYCTFTGGCKTFYSPQEWIERGELYGKRSVLIVVYDGSSVANVFNMDHAMETRYQLHTKMMELLAKEGFFAEECTNWYSAVYKVDNSCGLLKAPTVSSH